MTRKVNLELRELWCQRVDHQRQSGLTVSEFCRQEGVSSANFYRWKQKLQGKSPSKSKRRARQQPTGAPDPVVGPASENASATAFVRLPLAPSITSPWIELVLVEGTIIRVPQQNLAALQAVLQALRGVPRSSSLGEVRHA